MLKNVGHFRPAEKLSKIIGSKVLTTQDYAGDRDADWPAYTVFTKRDGSIRHFYSLEGSPEMADPGQDPHAAPDVNPLWILLDTTPEGRGADWYPKLDDKADQL